MGIDQAKPNMKNKGHNRVKETRKRGERGLCHAAPTVRARKWATVNPFLCRFWELMSDPARTHDSGSLLN